MNTRNECNVFIVLAFKIKVMWTSKYRWIAISPSDGRVNIGPFFDLMITECEIGRSLTAPNLQGAFDAQTLFYCTFDQAWIIQQFSMLLRMIQEQTDRVADQTGGCFVSRI